MVHALRDDKVIDAAVTATAVLAITGIPLNTSYLTLHVEDKKIYSWGGNSFGECGLNIKNPIIREPRAIPFFNGIQVEQVACGSTHVLVRDSEGRVYSYERMTIDFNKSRWGSPKHGKLGLEKVTQENLLEPQLVDGLAHKKVVHIAAGTEHSAALTGTLLLL